MVALKNKNNITLFEGGRGWGGVGEDVRCPWYYAMYDCRGKAPKTQGNRSFSYYEKPSKIRKGPARPLRIQKHQSQWVVFVQHY